MEEKLNELHEKALQACELEDLSLRRLAMDIIFGTIKVLMINKNMNE